MFSSIPIVKLAVTAALRTAFGSAVSVTYGHPGMLPGVRQAAYVEGTVGWDTDWAALGGQAKNEQYTLAFKLLASDPDATSFQSPTEAVFALADTAKSVIEAMLLVTGVNMRRPPIVVPGPSPFTEFYTDDKGGGRASLLDLGIRFDVRT